MVAYPSLSTTLHIDSYQMHTSSKAQSRSELASDCCRIRTQMTMKKASS